MACARRPRTSQGTDMMEYLRFPDAIEYELILKTCNVLAKPLASRTVCNKCYTLLWKAAYFSSSVFIGTKRVLDKLMAMLEDPQPCLVMLAADCFIDTEMTLIINTCKVRTIPFIFIPSKRSIGEALNVNIEILSVCITFNDDPGMRLEFEDCYVSIRSQCFKKKRRRRERRALPPEAASSSSKGESPQQLSSVPFGDGPNVQQDNSSDSDWLTIHSDAEMSENDSSDHDPECGCERSKDFSVNVPDESGSTFQEYVKIPSPTPAPPPSEMAAQKYVMPSFPIGETTTGSSDESPRPGPSRQFLTPPSRRHQQGLLRQQELTKRSSWPFSFNYSPNEELDDEKIKLYFKSMFRGNQHPGTSGPFEGHFAHAPTKPPTLLEYLQPSTSAQPPPAVPQNAKPEIIDTTDDDLHFKWTMDDLPTDKEEELIDLTDMNDSGSILEISSSDDDDVIVLEGASLVDLQNQGAAGGGDMCPVDRPTSSSQMAPMHLAAGEGGYPSRVGEPRNVYTARFADGNLQSPDSPSENQTSSSSSSGGIINLEPSSSNLFAFSDTSSGEPPVVRPIPPMSRILDVYPSTSRAPDNFPNAAVYANYDLPGPSYANYDLPPGPSGGVGDVPAVPAHFGGLGDAAAVPPVSRAGDMGEPRRLNGAQHPSAFGDAGLGDGNAWGTDPPNHRNFGGRYPHRPPGHGENGLPPLLSISLNFIFAPRIVYTASGEDGRYRGESNAPREEDVVDIPSPRTDDASDPLSARSLEVNASNDDEADSEDESELSDENYDDDEHNDDDEEDVKPPMPFQYFEE